MLNFITGRAGTGKTTLIRQKIAEIIKSTEQNITVIVPEQQTVAWETALAEMLPPSANLRMEITNFTRLSNSVFREYGGLADSLVDEGVRSLLIWRAMVSVWDEMTVYNNADGREDRNISALMQAVDELKNSGITPEDAEKALEALEKDGEGPEKHPKAQKRGGLRARLRDAVLVYSAYNAILHQEYIDRGDLLQKLGDKLERHPYFRGKAVFIDSFFSLTRAEERILGLIFRQTDDVWISFACPGSADSGEIQFGEVESFLKTAQRLAARANREIRFTSLTENLRHRDDPRLAAVERHLFRYEEEIPEIPADDGAGSVQIIRCTDRYDEAELCASLIDRLLRQGYRYSEIAVAARNIQKYEGIVDAVLRRHGIRCFMAESAQVSASPAVRMITGALMVAANNWQRKDVIRLLKTGMTPVTLNENGEMAAEVLELYTRTWNIRGRKMYNREWRMNPSGYKMELSERDQVMLRTANRAREELIPPLNAFLSVFDAEKGRADVRKIAEAAVEFARAYRVTESLAARAKAYREIGMPADADKTARSWDLVCEILDKLVLALDGTSLDAGKFAGLFMRVAQSMDVSSIPTGIDEVVLGSSSGVRYDAVRCVILLGSVSGEFLGTVSDEMFFDDSDRAALEMVGVTLSSPDRMTKTAREYFMYYRTAASAGEKLFILCPMEAGEMSEGAARVEKILPGCVTDFSKMPLNDVVFHRSTAEYLLSRRTDPEERRILERLLGNEVSDGGIPLTAQKDRITPARTGWVKPDVQRIRMPMTQSRIESFVMCPFNYSCRYLMKLQPEVRAEIAAPDIGIFIHSILERFFGETDPADLKDPVVLEKTVDGFIGEYLRELGRNSDPDAGGTSLDGRLTYLFVRLRRHVMVFVQALSEELGQSRFKPAAFELPVGMDGRISDNISIPLDENTDVVLRGVIDRVDLYESGDGKKYVRIVDYKTGSKSFSLEDIRRGIGVQLLVYLFSVWKSGLPGVKAEDLLPAGAVYFSVKPSVLSEKRMLTPAEAVEHAKSSIEKSGIVLAEEEILRAMDAELAGKYAPVKATASGLKGLNGTVCLDNVEEFGKLQAELESILCSIFEQMKSGNASAEPLRIGDRNPCGWCEHKYICKRALQG